jgi:hypothetical protein
MIAVVIAAVVVVVEEGGKAVDQRRMVHPTSCHCLVPEAEVVAEATRVDVVCETLFWA